MSYDICVTDREGKETWINYQFLKDGCINDVYFNWMYSLWTAINPDIRDMNDNGVLKKFVSCGFEGCKDNKDNKSQYKKFHCVKPNDWIWNQVDNKYYNSKWPDKNSVEWVMTPIISIGEKPAERFDWSKVDRMKLFCEVYGSEIIL